MKTLLVCLLALTLTAFSTNDLSRLDVDGLELHESLVTRDLSEVARLHVPRCAT